MRISDITLEALNRDQITRFLFGTDPYQGETGDCLFVFGGSGTDRTAKAVELYLAGKAPKILFSGGTVWGKRNPAEALVMREQAMQLGVPDSDILIEADSNHTIENVIASLLVLHRELGLHRIRRLIAVSAPYHRRRSLLALRTYMPQWVEVAWCPVDRPDCRPDNWWESPDQEQRVMGEARKVIQYVREGILEDGAI